MGSCQNYGPFVGTTYIYIYVYDIYIYISFGGEHTHIYRV